MAGMGQTLQMVENNVHKVQLPLIPLNWEYQLAVIAVAAQYACPPRPPVPLSLEQVLR